MIIVEFINVFCLAGIDGRVKVSFGGGMFFYDWFWLDMFGLDLEREQLSLGVYIIIIMDDSGCEKEVIFEINVFLFLLFLQFDCEFISFGLIKVSVSGGIFFYQYVINGGIFSGFVILD